MFSAFKKFGRMGGGSSIPWTPTKLFAAGEAGGLWDFSTLANLYQDSAGTTPCTAVGDPIGKVLDTSGRGNHLTQATSTKRPTLGRMPATGVRNLIVQSRQFKQSPWTNFNYTTDNAALAPDGTMTAALSLSGTSGAPHDGQGIQEVPTANVGTRRAVSLYVKQYTSPQVLFGIYDAGGWNGLAQVTFTVGAPTITTANGTLISPTATDAGNGWWRVSFMCDAKSAGWAGFYIYPETNTASYDGKGTYIWGAQAELAAAPTAYQKVGAAYDVTESGVASVYTAYFDGVDDCLVSPSIDFSGTDAMSVFSGFRKTSDAARGMVAELSATTDSNNGSFALTAPNAASATIVYESKGTSLTDTSATIAAPADSVISAVSDISADSNVLRRNGAEAESDTGDQGTGNFGNYPIYVGQRGAVSLPYKGFISALCTRGAATDAALVTSMEKWMAARTPGVTLP